MIFISNYFERKIVDLLGYGPRDSFFVRTKILIPRIFSIDIYIFASRFLGNAIVSAMGSVIGILILDRIYFNMSQFMLTKYLTYLLILFVV